MFKPVIRFNLCSFCNQQVAALAEKTAITTAVPNTCYPYWNKPEHTLTSSKLTQAQKLCF